MSQFVIQGLEETLVGERTRIVGLCATLTGNMDVAEDLAQEVMLEAWRSIERLRDVEEFSRWLSGIARNVCLRWGRKQGRHLAHLTQLSEQEIPLEEQIADEFDIEVELEHKELVGLLDSALAMLPPVTREVLVARYVEESSVAEVAERLGLQTGAVAMRLQRGKLALRRVLRNELGQEAQAYLARDANEWEETSVWCTRCGQHRLMGQFRPDDAFLFLVCPECGEYSRSHLVHTRESQMFQGMKRVKPALARIRSWMHHYYRGSLDTLIAPCLRCGQMVPIRVVASLYETIAEDFSIPWQRRGVYELCNNCQWQNWMSLDGLALALPEGQQFLREHSRVRTLPEQEVEVDGHAAVLTRFESVTEQARFEVVSTSDRYQVLCINGRRP